MCEIMEKINEDTKKEVTARINKLIILLMAEGRNDDLIRAASDPAYQEKLLDELVPEEE